jgi:hypothetical protein
LIGPVDWQYALAIAVPDITTSGGPHGLGTLTLDCCTTTSFDCESLPEAAQNGPGPGKSCLAAGPLNGRTCACVLNNPAAAMSQVTVIQHHTEEQRPGLDGQERRLGVLLAILTAVMFYGSIFLLVRSF